jgi:hypothetical protein
MTLELTPTAGEVGGADPTRALLPRLCRAALIVFAGRR